MKKLTLLFAMTFIPATWLNAAEMAITIHRLQSGNIGDSVGVIVAKDSPNGLVIEPYLRYLEMGTYELTVHENASCHGHYNKEGTIIPGASAGKKIADLTLLQIRMGGQAPAKLVASDLKLEDIQNHSIMVSLLDTSVAFDATATRVACGALEM